MKNVTIVLRAVAERTEGFCRYLIEQEFDPAQIVTVRVTPLVASVRAMFEAGINEGRDWTVVIDADTFIFKNSTQRLVEKAIKINSDSAGMLYWLQGRTLCKFLGGPRDGGTYVYNTAHLEKSLEFLPENDLRPENYIAKKMRDIGYKFKVQKDLVTCLHDHDQWYVDIFRKCLVQAIKHRDRIVQRIPQYKEAAKVDKDLYVALKGVNVGLQLNDDYIVDAGRGIDLFYKNLRIDEKAPINGTDFGTLRKKYFG